MPLLEIANLKKSYLAPDRRREIVVDVPHFALEAGAQIALRASREPAKRLS